MRYVELIEAPLHEPPSIEKFANNIKTIKQNCQPYLQQNPNALFRHALYRGIGSRYSELVVRKEVRLGSRRPKDMPYQLHQFINGYFQQEHGAAFRNAMFTTGSAEVATEYGSTFVIFPAGEFEYLWSPAYEDLFSITSEYDWNFATDALGREAAIKAKAEIKEKLVDDVLSTYKRDGLVEAIDSGHEIMIRCKYYYGIPGNIIYNKELRDKIQEILFG